MAKSIGIVSTIEMSQIATRDNRAVERRGAVRVLAEYTITLYL